MLGRIAIVTLACVAITAQAAGDVNLRGLQQLGVEVKNLADKSRDGYPPSVNDLSGLRRSLRMLQEAGTSADERLRTKYRSVSALLDTLSSPTSRDAAPRSTANRSVERVTETHGSTCDTALGISGEHPVAMTLARSGTLGDGAWFKLTSTQHSAFTITTDSTGADPALEVTGGCGGSSQVIAANDDSRGLDSSIVVAPTAGDAFVHVKNTGMAGEVTLSVKQALDSGTLSGQITDGSTGVGIPYAQVLIFDTELYYFITSLSTDSTGHFSQGLASGDYFVGANAAGFVMQLYPSGLCSARDYFNTIDGCDLSNTTPVVVPDGASTSSINIALSHGHSISGVTRDSNGVPIGNDSTTTLSLMNDSGSQLKTVWTDAVGHYVFDALPDDTYKVAAVSNGAYASQLYHDVACSGPGESVCDASRATPIIVAGADAVEIDFHLPMRAAVHGTVTNAAGNPIQGVAVNVYSAGGNQVAYGVTDTLGRYTTSPLDIGEFFVAASGDAYFSQLFSAYDCTTYCFLELAHGTPFKIVSPTQQSTANFQLHPLPVVTGHVQSAASGQPIEGVAVLAYPASQLWSWFDTAVTTDASGNFNFDDLTAGSYYLWARAPDYIDQIYSGLVCEPGDSYISIYAPCNLSGATLLVVEPGQTPVSPLFFLSPSASINGTVTTNIGSNAHPAAEAEVIVYNGTGTAFRSAETDVLGNYSVSDLPPGTYFAVANGVYSSQFWPQLWSALPCDPSCVPTTGSPIVVTANQAIQNVNFDLVREDAILGSVVDSDGQPVVSAIIDLFDASDLSYVGSTVVDAQGNYVATGNVGASYYVATEAGSGYLNQIYSGVECPDGAAFYGTCAFGSGTPLTLLASNTGPHVANFVLKRADKIFTSGFE